MGGGSSPTADRSPTASHHTGNADRTPARIPPRSHHTGLGGVRLVVGFLKPLAAAAVIGDMLNATVSDWHTGFFAPEGRVELALL